MLNGADSSKAKMASSVVDAEGKHLRLPGLRPLAPADRAEVRAGRSGGAQGGAHQQDEQGGPQRLLAGRLQEGEFAHNVEKTCSGKMLEFANAVDKERTPGTASGMMVEAMSEAAPGLVDASPYEGDDVKEEVDAHQETCGDWYLPQLRIPQCRGF